MKQDSSPEDGTRRRFLKATGLVGLVAGVGARATGQETGTETGTQETSTPAEDATPILLGGEVDHWFGLAPTAIHETENPTLTLRAGEKYRLVWMNLDGVEHELIVEDANGEELVATESATRAGVTRSVTFTASEQMAQYYCEYHPKSMRADVQIGEGFPTPTETPATDTPTGTPGC